MGGHKGDLERTRGMWSSREREDLGGRKRNEGNGGGGGHGTVRTGLGGMAGEETGAEGTGQPRDKETARDRGTEVTTRRMGERGQGGPPWGEGTGGSGISELPGGATGGLCHW